MAPLPSPAWKVFVSTTSDLARYPADRSVLSAAVKAIERSGHVAWHMWDAPAEPWAAPEVVQKRIAECDVVVVIAGFRYGTTVPDGSTESLLDGSPESYVAFELRTAVELDKPVLGFLIGEAFRGPREMHGDDPRQQEFRGRLAAPCRVVATVDSRKELTRRLTTSLSELATTVAGEGATRPSPWLRKARDLAPPGGLSDRDEELAELERFCTAADGTPSYGWWRGAAWTGKTALMATFVLNPPPEVRVVSFFVTARERASNDRDAFVRAALPQLSAILGRPAPDGRGPGERDDLVRDLLDEAAVACARRGERLVLVVDGADEDRGASDHSILGLLPAEPAADMRVVVAGRPHPPLPDDVAPGHPLRDPAVVRPLEPSPAAQIIEREARRDLDRLRDSGPGGRDLLGLATVAGGGLSRSDLVELTDLAPREVDRLLQEVTGRALRSQAGEWPPRPARYVLAHDGLHVLATGYLDGASRQRCLDRLHVWARRHAERHWPDDTPEYLARDYVALLRASHDVTRLVALAADTDRHDRLLSLTGDDSQGHDEITTAMGALLDGPDPDLAVVARLSASRDRLRSRNVDIPVDLPAVWAALGRPSRGIGLAGMIADPDRRAGALTWLARRLAGTDDRSRVGPVIDLAAAAAGEITTFAGWRADALSALAGLAADVGDRDRARSLAAAAEQAAMLVGRGSLYRSDYDRAAQAEALAGVAEVRVRTGDHARVDELVEQIAQLQATLRERAGSAAFATAYNSDRVSRARVRALLAAGRLDAAEGLAGSVTEPSTRVTALAAVARSCIPADPGRLGRLVATMESVTSAIDDVRYRRWALLELAGLVAERGDRAGVRALVERVTSAVPHLTDPDDRTETLVALAELLRSAGDADAAGTLLDEVEPALPGMRDPRRRSGAHVGWVRTLSMLDVARAQRVVDGLTDQGDRAAALTVLAATLADGTDVDGAAALAEQAEAQARAAGTGSDPGWVVAATVPAVAAVRGLGSALEAARSLEEPRARAEALTALAEWAVRSSATAEVAAERLDEAAAAVRAVEQHASTGYGRADDLWSRLAEAAAGGGDLARAGALAGSAGFREETTLVAVVEAALARDDVDGAARLTASTKNPYDDGPLDEVGLALVRGVLATGDIERAEEIARDMRSYRRGEAMAAVVAALAPSDLDRAHAIAESLREHELHRAEAITAVAVVAARAGDAGRAASLVESISQPYDKATAWGAVAEATAHRGDTDQAAALLMRGADLLRSIPYPDFWLRSAGRLATSVDRVSGGAEARAFVEQVVAVLEARSFTFSWYHLPDLVSAAVSVGAVDLALRAAATVDDHVDQEKARAEVAEAVALHGDVDRARAVLRGIAAPDERTDRQARLVSTLAARKDVEGAAAVAEDIADGYRRAWALARLVRAAPAGSADHLTARVLAADWRIGLPLLAEVAPAVALQVTERRRCQGGTGIRRS